MKNIAIIGAGSFGREVAWLIEDINKKKKEWNIVGFIDDNEEIQGKVINGYKVIGNIDSLKNHGEIYVSIGLGTPNVKEKIVNRLRQFQNVKFTNLIHPSAIIAPYVSLGIGNIICAGNILAVNARIENFVTINLKCTIGHDVILNDFITVAPGVNLSGFVTVGKKTDIGTNSCCIQGINIVENTIIGAGAVVVRDITEPGTYVGVPARKVFN
jgi:sugar O-acyltransferase (sialic acid O-acetyltransferase NeuD family)